MCMHACICAWCTECDLSRLLPVPGSSPIARLCPSLPASLPSFLPAVLQVSCTLDIILLPSL